MVYPIAPPEIAIAWENDVSYESAATVMRLNGGADFRTDRGQLNQMLSNRQIEVTVDWNDYLVIDEFLSSRDGKPFYLPDINDFGADTPISTVQSISTNNDYPGVLTSRVSLQVSNLNRGQGLRFATAVGLPPAIAYVLSYAGVILSRAGTNVVIAPYTSQGVNITSGQAGSASMVYLINSQLRLYVCNSYSWSILSYFPGIPGQTATSGLMKLSAKLEEVVRAV